MKSEWNWIIFTAVVSLLLVAFLSAVNVTSAVNTAGLQSGINQVQQKAQTIQNGVQQVQSLTQKQQLNHLSQQWSQSLLQNPVINQTNSVFMTIDSWNIFVIIFGNHYSFSLTFFFTLFFFAFIFAVLFQVLLEALPNNLVSLIGALGVTIILGQLGFYRWIFSFTFGTGWIPTIILFVLYLVCIIFTGKLAILIKTFFRKSQEKKKKDDLEQKVNENQLFIKGVEKGLN